MNGRGEQPVRRRRVDDERYWITEARLAALAGWPANRAEPKPVRGCDGRWRPREQP